LTSLTQNAREMYNMEIQTYYWKSTERSLDKDLGNASKIFWLPDDIAMQRTIRGHGKELLHIVFSDSFFNGVRVDAEEKRYARISTVENLMSITSALVPDGQTYLKPQDGFTKGEFEVDISITSNEGPFTQTKFMVSVEPNFQNLTMRRISFMDRFAE
jgi:hypothetical protein